jgi:DNA-binding response OmpR family regulator
LGLKNSSAFRILIVEDNIDIAENISDYLEIQGHVTDFAMDGISGLHLALTQDYDAIILDIMLPGMDGLTFCRKLREEGEKVTPVLILTARDTLSDKLEGFDAGADDYLVKPFELEELSARIQALVRRFDQAKKKSLRVGDLELDLGRMQVHKPHPMSYLAKRSNMHYGVICLPAVMFCEAIFTPCVVPLTNLINAL